MKKLIGANWKMHKNQAEARAFLKDLASGLKATQATSVETVLFPPFTVLPAMQQTLEQTGPCVNLGGQDVYPAEDGAFTGEISPDMLLDTGCKWVLTGHSDRRHRIGEDTILAGKKTAFALKHGLSVILCIGETIEQREAGCLKDILTMQIYDALRDVPEKDMDRLVVAYEPVWAIGTGVVASDKDIRTTHSFVRTELDKLPGGSKVRILYGGSVKPENAANILNINNVDGLLIGGSSLDVDSFLQIIHTAQQAA